MAGSVGGGVMAAVMAAGEKAKADREVEMARPAVRTVDMAPKVAV